MSDSDDDYMSDKLLIGSEKSDVRPGLLFNKSQKRTHDIYKKEIESRTSKRQKSYREQEKETREKGLNTAIPSDNVGFKMLQKMGFKAGSGIGKSDKGIKEPVNIAVKESSSGVGREQYVKETLKKRHKYKEVNLLKQTNEFRAANIEKSLMWILRRDFFKAQRVCEELDSRRDMKEPIEDYFWTRDTIKKLRENKDKSGTDSEVSESEEEEEEEEEISENKLFTIIEYLRENYMYCIYCAITGTDRDDLEANCPGPYRTDHDEDLE